MNIIGRKEEQKMLTDCLDSGRPEFMVVYGRRRIGKTFLIREYFDHRFSFYATGVNDANMSEQLEYFAESLKEYGSGEEGRPENWREAFGRLKRLLESDQVARDPVSGRRVVFLDELPWMDTPKSNFKTALDHFWNSWASSQSDMMLIVCGSATSWIIGNILTDKGGFYNRVTRQMHLMPFTLKECEEYFRSEGIQVGDQDVIMSYMVFGGVPYYLGLISRRMSMAQNIDVLLFDEKGALSHEFERSFQSLFRKPQKHMAVIRALEKRRMGMTRQEILEETEIADGALLTKTLSELVECGFIRKYQGFMKGSKGVFYQITDPFTLFCLTFLEKKKASSWMKHMGTPGYYAWCGLAFETVCLNHVAQIKNALGISGIESAEYAWRSSKAVPGAQIDLLIDRADNVINVCEMKYSSSPFEIDKDYAGILNHKMNAFRDETKTKKALHLTLVSAGGLSKGGYSGMVVNEIGMDDLFGRN